jgi:hydroxymethylbilane synthase
VALPDGSRSLQDSLDGPAGDAEEIGRQLAASLLEQGAGELLEQAAATDG